jgi:hypothetical protein
MNKRTLTWFWALTLTLCALCTLHAQAQSAIVPGEHALRVTGLTSELRDALTRELERSGDGRMVFACVPAGILVLADTRGRTSERFISTIQELLVQRGQDVRIEPLPWTIQQAETACANARNR